MNTLVAVNNYLHDFSAALWVATLVMGYLLARSQAAEGCACHRRMYRGLSRLFWGSLAGTIAFGAVRALAYRRYEWVDSLGESQVTLLIVKHVAFTLLVVAGIVYWIRIGRRVAPLKEGLVEA